MSGITIGDRARRLIGAGTMEGNPEHELAEKRAEHLRAARLDAVRRNRRWTELAETSLVRRGPFLVSAETDEMFMLRRGVIFEPGKASIGYVSEDTELHYYVDQAGEIVFLERQPGTWSEVFEKRARRAAGAR